MTRTDKGRKTARQLRLTRNQAAQDKQEKVGNHPLFPARHKEHLGTRHGLFAVFDGFDAVGCLAIHRLIPSSRTRAEDGPFEQVALAIEG